MATHGLQRLQAFLQAAREAIEARAAEIRNQARSWLDENDEVVQQAGQKLLDVHNRVTGAYIGPLILESGNSSAAQLLNGLGLLSIVLQQSPSDMDEEERLVVTKINETLSQIIEGAEWDAFGKVDGLKPMNRLIKRLDALMGEIRDPDADVDEKHRGRIAESLGELEKSFGIAARSFVFPDGTPLTKLDDPSARQYVTLDQMAAMANRAKKTLERWLEKGKLPEPDVEGGGGKPHEWLWHRVRKPLQNESGKTMPDRFPSLRQRDRH